MGQQVEPDRHRRGAEDGEDPVPAPPADQPPGGDRGGQQAGHQRQQPQPGDGRADALDDLHVLGQVGDRPEHGEPDDEADRARRGEYPVAEQVQRNDGLGGPALRPDEPGAEDHRTRAHEVDRRGGPGIGGPAQRGEQHQAGRRAGQQHRAEVVDLVRGPAQVPGQHRRDHGQRHDADRQVDVEHPAPRQVVHEEPADQRAEDAGHAEHAAEQALVAASFPGRHHVGDDRLRAGQQAAAADALDRAERDQLRAWCEKARPAPSRSGRSRSRPGRTSSARTGRRACPTAGWKWWTPAGTRSPPRTGATARAGPRRSWAVPSPRSSGPAPPAACQAAARR